MKKHSRRIFVNMSSNMGPRGEEEPNSLEDLVYDAVLAQRSIQAVLEKIERVLQYLTTSNEVVYQLTKPSSILRS